MATTRPESFVPARSDELRNPGCHLSESPVTGRDQGCALSASSNREFVGAYYTPPPLTPVTACLPEEHFPHRDASPSEANDPCWQRLFTRRRGIVMRRHWSLYLLAFALLSGSLAWPAVSREIRPLVELSRPTAVGSCDHGSHPFGDWPSKRPKSQLWL